MKQFFISLFLKIMSSKAIYIPLLTGAVVATSGGVVAGVVHYQHTHEVVSAETDAEETTTRDFKLKETNVAVNSATEQTTEEAVEPIEIIPIEELEIVEDNSSEPVHDAPVEESSGISSTGVYETSQLVYGIDVSKWQGDIDWARVANSGITFAIIKCGGNEGGLYKDVKFEQNIQGALANGIQVGVYFYSGATNSQTALEEASLCLELIKGYPITYPVAIDWEMPYGSGSREGVTSAITTFCDVVASHGYTPMVYSNKYRYYDCFDGATITSKYKTWMACYFSEYYYTSTRWKYGDDLPDFDYGYDMWQYGVTDTVDGINGMVDMNIAFFGYANYQAPGLKEAKLTVTNTDNYRYINAYGELNESFDPMAGVKGTNSLGYDADIDYHVYAGWSNYTFECSLSDALRCPDSYLIKYSFSDPKKGSITASAKLTVARISAEITASDLDIQVGPDGLLPAGSDLTSGVYATNSLGEEGSLTDYSIIRTSKADGSTATVSTADVFDPDSYTYIIRYYFDVPQVGTTTKDVNFNIIK